MSLHCIVWCCMVLYCWLRRAGCISQDTYLLYVVDEVAELLERPRPRPRPTFHTFLLKSWWGGRVVRATPDLSSHRCSSPPANCSSPIYGNLTQIWHQLPYFHRPFLWSMDCTELTQIWPPTHWNVCMCHSYYVIIRCLDIWSFTWLLKYEQEKDE